MRMNLQDLQFAEIRKEIAQRMDQSGAVYQERLERAQNHWDLCSEGRIARIHSMIRNNKWISGDRWKDYAKHMWKDHRIKVNDSNPTGWC